ncbi:hypothetical protein [Sutcliffiella horikoshii]|uniref:hypothetical protein n=1 Tax=Sutcliffiella horikoshii TaxID=79883 RepID=UPI001F1675A2|nr:hypothetical protein [Sutcliffiella horikoshii]MCG1021564.1 hypothetical protein [Sutcliffiella horikoshii]
MEETKERYVLYEFLEYFWKKKWIFVVLPITLAIVAFGLTKFTEERPYTALKTVYLGSESKGSFSDPVLVKNDYGKFIDRSLRKNLEMVPNNRVVVFSLTGGSQSELEEQLDRVTENYFRDLVEDSERTKNTMNNQITALEMKKQQTEKEIEKYKGFLDREELDPLTIRDYLQRLSNQEDILFEYTFELTEEQNNLENYEEPRILDTVVSQQRSNLKTNVAAAFLFGLFLSLLLVTLLKYIQDAKRGRRYD